MIVRCRETAHVHRFRRPIVIPDRAALKATESDTENHPLRCVGWLFRRHLQGFEVRHEGVDTGLDGAFVLRLHPVQNRPPNRHLLALMGGKGRAAVDDGGHFIPRKNTPPTLRDRGEVGQRRPQRGCCRPIALARAFHGSSRSRRGRATHLSSDPREAAWSARSAAAAPVEADHAQRHDPTRRRTRLRKTSIVRPICGLLYRVM